MEKPESSDQRQDARHGSSECPPALNENAPLTLAPQKIFFYAYFKRYIYTQGISAISTINAPKWRQSAANCRNMEIFELCNVFELGCAFRLNLANYKRNYKKN